ncbi:MAG: hypothetical protein JWR38_487 [Mucilaginibacter sp.]|nr:hypothetical protein [Mucilaginibacter sp.]
MDADKLASVQHDIWPVTELVESDFIRTQIFRYMKGAFALLISL